jgi:acetyltransferase-like isoleucine patch superfamily enzyme/glycosyltransferase involved in cell wall biosynthesis
MGAVMQRKRKLVDVLIQTYNEELNLPHTLESLRGWTNRVFVVDSGSTDRTVQIAEQFGAIVVHHDWEGYARQKNWAIRNLPFEADWTLIVDADEAVSPELRQEIVELVARPVDSVEEAGFHLNRVFIFFGQEIRHCGYFPSWNLRLFKRGRAIYEDRSVHEHMIVDGPTGYLDQLLIHEDRRGLEHFFAKHNRYSTLEAQEFFQNPEPWPGLYGFLTDRVTRRRFGKSRILPRMPMPWLWRLIYMYIVRLGFMDGRAGWMLCNFIASYEFFVQLKYRELKRIGKTHSPVRGLSESEGRVDLFDRGSDHASPQLLAQINQRANAVRLELAGEMAELNQRRREIERAIGGQPITTSSLPAAVRSVAAASPDSDDPSGKTPHQRALTDTRLRAEAKNATPHKFVSPWTLRQNMGRVLWMIVWRFLFRLSFHNWYAWRRMLLRLFGARIGRDVRIRPTVRIEIPWNLNIGDGTIVGDDAILYSLGPITLGKRVVISQYAHLCAGTHDYRIRTFPLVRPPITIGDEAWVAADAFVGPGVNIGARAILGARSSAFRDIAEGMIAAGNPAREVKPREQFIDETA